MSFNINKADIEENDENNIPAYQRRNVTLDEHQPSGEDLYSNMVVKNNSTDSPIGTLNSFLNGKNPDQ